MYRLLLFIGLLIPVLILFIQVFIIEVTDPIKYMYTITGVTSTILIFFTIIISMMKKWINLMKFRRMIGLYSFFYALLHFLVFFILDSELDISFVLKETLDKPFIYLGVISLFFLFLMAITSTKNLFKKFNKYHSIIYIVAILVILHLVMAQKTVTGELLFYLGIIFIIGCFKFWQKIQKL